MGLSPSPFATVPGLSTPRRLVMLGVFGLIAGIIVFVTPTSQSVTCSWEGDAVRCAGRTGHLDGSASDSVNVRVPAGSRIKDYEYRSRSGTSGHVCAVRFADGVHLFDVSCAERQHIAASMTALAGDPAHAPVTFKWGSMTGVLFGAAWVFVFGVLFAVMPFRRRCFFIRGTQLEIVSERLPRLLTTRRSIALADIVEAKLDCGQSRGTTRCNTWVRLASGKVRILAVGGQDTTAGQQALLAGITEARAVPGTTS